MLPRLLFISGVEWRQPSYKFVQEGPKCVVVNAKIVSGSASNDVLLEYHFRWHVLRTPTVRVCHVLFGHA